MSITVHGIFKPVGCSNPPSGGVTCFCDLPDCVSYCATPIWSGEHAGMIALTITNANNNEACNDTFYGCLNFTTHQWEVAIPDDCCVVDCCAFNYMFAKFSGISITSGCCTGNTFSPSLSGVANSTYRLYKAESCGWRLDFGTNVSVGRINYDDYENCTGESFDWITPSFTITVFTNYAGADYNIQFAFLYGGLFAGNIIDAVTCGGVADNLNTSPCGFGETAGYGGTCELISDCSTSPAWAVGVYYYEGNVVQNGGQCYHCILAHTSSVSNEPPNATYWELI